MIELPTIGRSYTWMDTHVYSRIDRAIMNSLFSDHSPLGIEVEGTFYKKKRIFKFYNCMAEHPEFGRLVEAIGSCVKGE